ncbi:MAG: exosortase system-associated protein, TIGR04073 family [Candidatus Omnitrophica bacterium]|nr:exosortase system-associated protein, TIGR04073 family [Candidatus Omnitrophota bacterium]
MRTAWPVRILLVVSALWGGVPPARSDEGQFSSAGQDRVEEVMGRYNLHPAFAKLGRGLSNALGGCLELPLNVQKRYSKTDTGGSFLTGVSYGLFKAVVRTGVGIYETATFFLPYPEDYAPILPTLEYFQKATKRKPLPLE